MTIEDQARSRVFVKAGTEFVGHVTNKDIPYGSPIYCADFDPLPGRRRLSSIDRGGRMDAAPVGFYETYHRHERELLNEAINQIKKDRAREREKLRVRIKPKSIASDQAAMLYVEGRADG